MNEQSSYLSQDLYDTFMRMQASCLYEQIREFFVENSAGLVCAYVFGSIARGDARSTSDVDIGVLYDKTPPSTLDGLGLRLAGDLERRLGKEVDLVVLNRAPVDLIHRILRDGFIAFDRDPSARILFEVKARNEYFDLRPILDRYRQGTGNSADG